VVVVTAPRDVQIARVGRRRKMDKAQVRAVIARQMPDAAKRRRADHVVRTGLSRHHAQRAIRRLVRELAP
jgi:dephospho-CoA kinase